MLFLAFSLLIIPFLYAVNNVPDEVLKTLPGNLESNEIPKEVLETLPGTISQEDQLPEAVRAVLKQQSDYYLGLRLEEEQKRKEELLYNASKIIEKLALIVIIIVLIYLISNLIFSRRLYEKIRRRLRRAYLYYWINNYLKKGKTFKEIELILFQRRFDSTHIRDAVIRYKKNHHVFEKEARNEK